MRSMISNYAKEGANEDGSPKKTARPKSLAISTPTKLLSLDEARSRALTTAIKPDQSYIEVGNTISDSIYSFTKNYIC